MQTTHRRAINLATVDRELLTRFFGPLRDLLQYKNIDTHHHDADQGQPYVIEQHQCREKYSLNDSQKYMRKVAREHPGYLVVDPHSRTNFAGGALGVELYGQAQHVPEELARRSQRNLRAHPQQVVAFKPRQRNAKQRGDDNSQEQWLEPTLHTGDQEFVDKYAGEHRNNQPGQHQRHANEHQVSDSVIQSDKATFQGGKNALRLPTFLKFRSCFKGQHHPGERQVKLLIGYHPRSRCGVI